MLSIACVFFLMLVGFGVCIFLFTVHVDLLSDRVFCCPSFLRDVSFLDSELQKGKEELH